jgi:uncharacterized protein YfbU (UPF0304 family)
MCREYSYQNTTMTPKSERFEMRVDENLLARIDEWSSEQDDVPSRAEAVRRLIELGLRPAPHQSVRFSDGEKLILMMLRDLYKHMEIRDREIDPDFIAEVIWGGHYWAPKWALPGLYHDHEDRPEELSFVVDVLDMWDFLERGYERLSKAEQDRIAQEAEPFGKHVKFTGFDGNSEASYIGIARFLVEQMNRFSRFEGRELNAHMPTLATYQRMMPVFEPIRTRLVGRDLNAGEIIQILNAEVGK